jgi:hypothetical protein
MSDGSGGFAPSEGLLYMYIYIYLYTNIYIFIQIHIHICITSFSGILSDRFSSVVIFFPQILLSFASHLQM